jgi:hypothetical protein
MAIRQGEMRRYAVNKIYCWRALQV